ncbi:hypothetical protein J43TS9_63880 [Paenibacillus cineris]|nr:hypothetical protein J43TS9_63880 [Paenibacillus cineris]
MQERAGRDPERRSRRRFKVHVGELGIIYGTIVRFVERVKIGLVKIYRKKSIKDRVFVDYGEPRSLY